MAQGLYLFGLARAAGVDHLGGAGLQVAGLQGAGLVGGGLEVAGLDGQAPLEILSFREIAALFCRVDLEEFCGPEAPARLQDLAWVGPRACRHEAVLQEVMRSSPVLPVRFGTIFSSPEPLQEVLATHHDTVRDFLNRVAGREEWAVKGLLDRSRAKKEYAARYLARHAGRLAALSAGRRYFEEQRLRSQAEQELGRHLRERCREAWASLQEKARESCELRVPSRGAGPEGGEILVNWAFLVGKAEVPAFQARLGAINEGGGLLGLTFATTGPWPPYSFSPTLT